MRSKFRLKLTYPAPRGYVSAFGTGYLQGHETLMNNETSVSAKASTMENPEKALGIVYIVKEQSSRMTLRSVYVRDNRAQAEVPARTISPLQ